MSVAVLIPVFNNSDGLIRSVSALNIEPNISLVIVDDGSIDPINLADTIHSFDMQILRLEKNLGIDKALNIGLSEILSREYKYIARLDAGDRCFPGRFEKQVAFLENHPKYAMVGGQVKFVNPSGKEVFQERFPTCYEDIRRIMHARNCFIHPAVMIRTEVLREVGPYSEDYPAAEDYELFMRITQRYPVANLDDFVLEYEVSPFGISITKRRRQVLSRLKVMIRYFDPKLKESYLGILKNTLLFFLPYPVVVKLKSILREKRGWL